MNRGKEVNFSDILAAEHKRTVDEVGLNDAILLSGQAARKEGVSRTVTAPAAKSEVKSVKRTLVGLQGERLLDVSEILNAPIIKCSLI